MTQFIDSNLIVRIKINSSFKFNLPAININIIKISRCISGSIRHIIMHLLVNPLDFLKNLPAKFRNPKPPGYSLKANEMKILKNPPELLPETRNCARYLRLGPFPFVNQPRNKGLMTSFYTLLLFENLLYCMTSKY